MKKATHLLAVWAMTLLVAFLTHSALSGPVGNDLDFFFLYKVLRGDPSGKVAIVKIDNASLDELWKTDFRVLNFTKTTMAELVRKLRADGAAAIGLDVIFANRSPDEGILAETLAERPDAVIAAKVWTKGDSERVLPLISFSGAKWGAVDVLFDKNVVSRIPPYLTTPDGRGVETLAVATYRAMLNDASPVWKFSEGRYLVNPIRSIPLREDSSALIPFFREPKEYPAYALSDVLSGKVPKWTFEGKAVLVGEYGTLIHDEHFSPADLGKVMPGVEFHANFLDALITGKFLRGLSTGELLAVSAIAALAGAAVFLFASVPASVAYVFVFLSTALFAGWYAMVSEGIVISLFSLSVAWVFAAFPVAYAYRYFVVDRDRHFIEKAFSRYVDPEVVDAIASNPEKLNLGWEKRHVAVFFSDIAGFTTISETIGTEKLFALIGEYLSQMTDILIKNRWTLDKYVGDAVMGIFWAPLVLENPEISACHTALEQQARLRMLRSKWKKAGYPLVEARIGIHSWEAMVGNIWSKTRFNYTAMGDTVNLASRLEGVNKEYGTFICVSEPVATAASSQFVFRELDSIKVKGKNEGVRIFELVGYSDDPYVDKKKIAAYESALAAYREWKFQEAKAAFSSLKSDPPSLVMAERCDALIGWSTSLDDGTYIMTSK